MPRQVEECVQSLLRQWQENPSKRPPPKEEGQSAKDQAWAICQGAYNKRVQNSLAIMFDGGLGPALVGAAATNRPYIPQLKPTRVEGEEGDERFLVHLANSGEFNHPMVGPFILNRNVFALMQSNFHKNVVGQDLAYDCRHQPDKGAFGWFVDLKLGDEVGEGEKEFWGVVKPTPFGLEQIKGGQYRYSSMEFFLNYERSDVKLDLQQATVDNFCAIETEEDVEVGDMPDNKEELEKVQAELQSAQEERKRVEEEAKAARLEAEEARKELVRLQQEAINSRADDVIELAQKHRDSEGNALPRQLVEWVAKVLKFETLGEGEKAIKLSKDAEVGSGVREYLISAIKKLVLEMPGLVPAERHTSDGQGSSKEDNFDYRELWDEEG